MKKNFFSFSSRSFDQDRNSRSRTDSLDDGGYPDYFVKKEALTPPGSAKNHHTIGLNNNNNDSEGGSTVLRLKTEPIGNPDSPESTSIDNSQSLLPGDDCAGCGRLIQVRKIADLRPLTLAHVSRGPFSF